MTFDWQPFKQGTGDFAKFEEIGDDVVGRIVAIRKHTFDEKKGEVALIDLEQKDGTEITLACDKVDLRRQIADIEPQVSDMLAVKYTSDSKTPNGRMKVFTIRHKQGERPAVSSFEPEDTPDLDDYSEAPF